GASWRSPRRPMFRGKGRARRPKPSSESDESRQSPPLLNSPRYSPGEIEAKRDAPPRIAQQFSLSPRRFQDRSDRRERTNLVWCDRDDLGTRSSDALDPDAPAPRARRHEPRSPEPPR